MWLSKLIARARFERSLGLPQSGMELAIVPGGLVETSELSDDVVLTQCMAADRLNRDIDMPKLVAAAAASTPGDKPAESSESTEQLFHADLGWSPKYERVPTRSEFIEAMVKWGKGTGRVILSAIEDSVIVFVDGRQVASVRVRA